MYEIKDQLKKLKLPDICVSDGKEYFLDPVREKLILKTPEEVIRQEIIQFLLKVIHVPSNMLQVEMLLSKYGVDSIRRADLVIERYTKSKDVISPLAIIECVLALGIGLALGAVDAYVQDLEYIVNFILMMAFYGSPIVYQMSLFESNTLFLKIIQLNPMTKIIMGYRDAFLYHVTPPLTDFIYVSVIACIVLVLGYMIFKKLEKGFAEQF